MGEALTPRPPSDPAEPGASAAPPPRRGRWGRRLGIGCLGLVVLVVALGLIAWFVKPWAPTVEVADPGAGGQRVTGDGYLGNYYPAADAAPAVIVLGGSEGGISGIADHTARQLRDEGYSTLALSYFGADEQPDHIEHIPLELFDAAIAWLQQQPAVAPGGVGLVGASKGAEAALLVAGRNAEVAVTVAYVPSSVAWQGFNLVEPWASSQTGASWSADGAPVPFLPFGESRSFDLYEFYAAGLRNIEAHPDAAIAIERSSAPTLLVCGASDTLWPSCEMSRALEQRAAANGGPAVTVLEYSDAGHLISGAPITPEQAAAAELDAFGGTTEANLAAQHDAWPTVLAHLAGALRA